MSKIEVAAFYFPNFHPDKRNEELFGKGWTEWDMTKRSVSRFEGHVQPKKPIWGYEDESDPIVMEKKIQTASDYGLDSWIFDWYYYDDGPFLQNCLDKGFLNAKNRDQMKFSLMWANHDWYYLHQLDPLRDDNKTFFHGQVTAETFEKIMDLTIEKYFKQPNYWKIDGCPFFSIYEINTLSLSYKSPAELEAALELFRSKVKAAGFPDLHLNIMYWGEPNLPGGRTTDDWPGVMTLLKADSATSYTWVHHGALQEFPATPYPEARERYMETWAETRELLPVQYFPNVTMGWDNSPRSLPGISWEKPLPHTVTPTLVGNTPAEFKKSLLEVKSTLEKMANPPKVVTINAWNEWPESSVLEPEEEFGYGYLEAIRDVFGNKQK